MFRESGLTMFESVLTRFESVLMFFESRLIFFESVLKFCESVLMFFEYGLIFFESVFKFRGSTADVGGSESPYFGRKRAKPTELRLAGLDLFPMAAFQQLRHPLPDRLRNVRRHEKSAGTKMDAQPDHGALRPRRHIGIYARVST
jgi:hypothetical protein